MKTGDEKMYIDELFRANSISDYIHSFFEEVIEKTHFYF